MTIRTYAELLVNDVAFAGPERITPQAIGAAADRLLDTIGVALAGALTREARPVAALAFDNELAPSAQGTLVWGWGRSAPLQAAVLANGVAAHALDYDDSNTHAGLHPGSIVVPVALAIAQQRQCSGQEVLAAIAAGYQVAATLGRYTFGKFKGSASSACGLFAAVITAARLRKIAPDAAMNALGLAGSFLSGTNEYLASGGDSKPLQHGWAAQSAFVALALAERGAVGPRRIFEGEFGIFRTLCGIESSETLLADNVWSALEVTRSSIKPYPVCHTMVPVATAWLQVLERMRAEGLDPFVDVERITCRVPDFSARFMLVPMEAKRRPATAHQARFSMPWCLGKLALDGRLDLQSFEQQFLTHEAVLSLAARVDYELVPRTDVPYFIAGGLRVTLRGGQCFEAFCEEHAGGPTQPLSQEQLWAKFLDAGSGCGTPAQLQQVLAEIARLPSASSAQGLLHAMGALDGASRR